MTEDAPTNLIASGWSGAPHPTHLTRTDRLKAFSFVVLAYIAFLVAWSFMPTASVPSLERDPPTLLIDIPDDPLPPPADIRPVKKALRLPRVQGGAVEQKVFSPPVTPRSEVDLDQSLPGPPTVHVLDANATGPDGGGSGFGAGGGGGGIVDGEALATPAKWLSGELLDSDYPRWLFRSNGGGAVVIRFRILASGKVDRCRIVRSSGLTKLDLLTCDIMTRRLKFAAARDAAGRAIASEGQQTCYWSFLNRRDSTSRKPSPDSSSRPS